MLTSILEGDIWKPPHIPQAHSQAKGCEEELAVVAPSLPLRWGLFALLVLGLGHLTILNFYLGLPEKVDQKVFVNENLDPPPLSSPF